MAELFRRSRHDWTLYTHHLDRAATFPDLQDAPIVELQPRVGVRRSLTTLARAGTTIGSARLPDDGSRALLVSSESLGDLALLRTRLPAVAYCHTPLKILHDPVTRAALAAQSAFRGRAVSMIGPGFTALQRFLWRRYRHVFVNSAETRSRVARAGLVPGGPVEVLHPGVDTERFTPGIPSPDPYFLVAGRIMWEKEIELAIEALRRARRSGLRTRMVVAGAVDAKSRPYVERLRSLGAGLPVTFEIDPDDARLAHLYRGATAVVFTPPNEDFGIVPLEAMAAGTPVVARDAGGPRETVVDGSTGWLIPGDPGSFAAKLVEIEAAGPHLEPMRRAARARALEFSWQAFVDRVDDVMEAAVTI